MADILTHLHVRFPYVIHNRLYMILALGTFFKTGTACTVSPTAFVLAISLVVVFSIDQHLIVATDIAVVILIINILVFLEETLFCHGRLYGRSGLIP